MYSNWWDNWWKIWATGWKNWVPDPAKVYVGASSEMVTELPAGFPAYCIYFPTGMNRDFEMKALARLKEWGKTMGRNLLVADWDIGDISYQIVGKKLRIRTLPSILLTDSNDPGANDFWILIEDQSFLRNVDKLIEVLPNLVNLILTGQSNEVKDAIKHAIKIGQGSKIKSLLKPISTGLSKLKTLEFSYAGCGIEIGLR